jgi:hypothetical protein
MIRDFMASLTAKVGALQHNDNIEFADQMEAWKNDPKNKRGSKPGDDRSPAFRWLGSLYHDGRVVGWPNDNLSRMCMEGGSMVLVPGGRSGKTFKAQTQSGMLIDGSHWPLLVDGKPIPVEPLLALQSEPSFVAHRAAASKAGFTLHVKRVKIGNNKHVRVRPLFERWSTSGLVHVWDEQITLEVLTQIFNYAGLYKGLGDWRPGGRTPGPFGMFTATVKEA